MLGIFGVSSPPSLGRPFFVHHNHLRKALRRNCHGQSRQTATDVKEAVRNLKRMQREVRKQVESTGIGTKSQQALKLQQEQMKTERKIVSRERRGAEKERRFELKQQKGKTSTGAGDPAPVL